MRCHAEKIILKHLHVQVEMDSIVCSMPTLRRNGLRQIREFKMQEDGARSSTFGRKCTGMSHSAHPAAPLIYNLKKVNFSGTAPLRETT